MVQFGIRAPRKADDLAYVQGQLNESVTADSPVHKRLVIEWSVAPTGDVVRPDEPSILRNSLEGVIASRAGVDALSQPSLYAVASAFLGTLQKLRNDTAHVTVSATGSSASAYIVWD